MLKQLRHKKTARKIFFILAIIIVPAFIFWGSGSIVRDRMKASFAGEIFGKRISMDDFRDAYIAVRTQALIRFGDNLPQVEHILNLEERAWERLILLKKVHGKRIEVTNDEVVKIIAAYPFFQKQGNFDNKLYQEILRYGLRIKVRDFERQIKESLAIEKLFKELNKKIGVSQEEMLSEFKKDNEEINVLYISFNNEGFKQAVSIDQIKVEDFFKANQEAFRTQPQLNIEYIGIDLGQEANEEEKAQAQEKITSILEETKKDRDLASIAKEHQLEIKKSGLFAINEPIPEIGWSLEFLEAISQLNPGEISGVIKTAAGVYIAKLLEIKEPYLPEFEEASEKIIEAMKKKQAKELALRKAYEIKERLSQILEDTSGEEFKKRIEGLGLNLAETSFFKRGQYLEKIGISNEFSKESFSLVTNPGVLAIASSSKASFIIKLLEFKPADTERFKKEKETYRTKLLAQKEQEASFKFLEELKAQANLKNNLSKIKQAQQ